MLELSLIGSLAISEALDISMDDLGILVFLYTHPDRSLLRKAEQCVG